MYGKEYIEWKEIPDTLIDRIQESYDFYKRVQAQPTVTPEAFKWYSGVLTGLHTAMRLIKEHETQLRTPERNIQREALRQSDSLRTVPAPESRKGFGIGGWAT